VTIRRTLSSFVGPESELAKLEALLRRARLVTLAGPGGIGKTHLALALIERAGFVDPRHEPLHAPRDAILARKP
jgi:MoxR-like ATPase